MNGTGEMVALKPSTYDAFRKHQIAGVVVDPVKGLFCDVCGIEVVKSNTTHLKKCPNMNKQD